MVGEILFILIAFLLFTYIFIFKLIKKNNTDYLFLLMTQAIGILLNFIQIIFKLPLRIIFKMFVYLLCLILPVIVLLIEYKGLSFSELLYVGLSKIFLMLNNIKMAKKFLFKLISEDDKSYRGHKMLATIYEQENDIKNAIDEYVKVLDIKGNDYNAYFKISKLLLQSGKINESMQMLTELIKKKPDLYEANNILR